MINQKKGISGVVTTALLLLLTISAVVIVAGYIIPFVKKSLDSTSCFEYRDYYSFDESFNFNCFDTANHNYIFSVKSRVNEEGSERVRGFDIKLIGNSSAIKISVREGDSPGNIRLYDNSGSLDIPLAGGDFSSLSYNYSSYANYSRMEIYAALDDRICDLSDSIKISEC